ncbi:AMIN-like domain-containing (lipo)protein [Sinomonas halotolerans]|uniref:AMIN-like domain-containing protein n=1 Tax=Sinomonas halotolerans TaxID=1644133 RepID=A0ABU9X388_9MICC
MPASFIRPRLLCLAGTAAVLLSGCVGQPSPAPTATVTTTVTATVTATATSSPSAPTPPADTSGTASPRPGDRVISSALKHDWGIPAPGSPWRIAHELRPPIAQPPEPPLPYLYTIGVGAHPSGEARPYDQMSFRFKGAFPGYELEYVPQLIQDGSGATIPMPGTAAVLRIRFNPAQAHTEDGTASTIVSAPDPAVGYTAITRYASAGDFEGYLTYGVGVGRAGSSARSQVRVIEVEKIEQGQHLFVVAVQVDQTPWRR